MKILALLVAASGLLLACDRIPADPEGTLDRVSGGTMRVGVTIDDPWVTGESDGFGGIEIQLIEAFAEEIDAEIEYFEGSEEELFAALTVHELDVVIGGFTSQNPHAMEAGMTHPYVTTAVVVGVPEGEDVGDDIAGREVAAERGTETAGLLRKTDAIVVEVDSIDEAPGAAAVEDYLLDDLSLIDTGIRLSESDHVMVVQTGENDFMTRLESFLLDNSAMVEDLLEEQSP
jgi:polar amino acid transport system substrate-binding protein